MHLCKFVGHTIRDVRSGSCSAVRAQYNTVFECNGHTGLMLLDKISGKAGCSSLTLTFQGCAYIPLADAHPLRRRQEYSLHFSFLKMIHVYMDSICRLVSTCAFGDGTYKSPSPSTPVGCIYPGILRRNAGYNLTARLDYSKVDGGWEDQKVA